MIIIGALKPEVSSPKHSPLLWAGEGHKNLPPHFIQVAGMDPLRDDGLIYTLALQKSGVSVQTVVYSGVPHAFDAMAPHLEVTKKFVGDRNKWIGENLP